MDKRLLHQDENAPKGIEPSFNPLGNAASEEQLERDIQRLLDNKKEKREFNIQDVVNSKKVNQSLLQNTQEMFELEFDIKMKAQLKYLEYREK